MFQIKPDVHNFPCNTVQNTLTTGRRHVGWRLPHSAHFWCWARLLRLKEYLDNWNTQSKRVRHSFHAGLGEVVVPGAAGIGEINVLLLATATMTLNESFPEAE